MKKVNNFLNYFKLVGMYNNSNISKSWFEIVRNIVDFCTEANDNKRAIITKIAMIDFSKEKVIGDFDMVSLWAGIGDTSPIERCRHLKAQNDELKRLLTICKNKVEFTGNEVLLSNVNVVLATFE